MKSVGARACQINMKGKKTIKLSCGCCTAIDFRDKILKNIAKKEIARPLD